MHSKDRRQPPGIVEMAYRSSLNIVVQNENEVRQ